MGLKSHYLSRRQEVEIPAKKLKVLFFFSSSWTSDFALRNQSSSFSYNQRKVLLQSIWDFIKES